MPQKINAQLLPLPQSPKLHLVQSCKMYFPALSTLCIAALETIGKSALNSEVCCLSQFLLQHILVLPEYWRRGILYVKLN